MARRYRRRPSQPIGYDWSGWAIPLVIGFVVAWIALS